MEGLESPSHCTGVVPSDARTRHGFLRWLHPVQSDGDPSRLVGRGPFAAGEGPPARVGAGERASRWWTPIGLSTLLVFGFAWHARVWAFTCDDAFISFRYAANFAATGELAYNLAPLERVEGYTNFLWVVMLAACARVGVQPHVAAGWLAPMSSALGLVFAVLVARTLRLRWFAMRRDADGVSLDPGLGASAWHLFDLAPALLLTAMPEWMVWSSSGLEAGATGTLFLATVWAWETNRIELSGALAATLGLLRLDALVAVAGYGVGWALLHGPTWWSLPQSSRPRLPWRRVMIATVCFVTPLALHLVFRLGYYGAPLPHTWTVKRSGALLRGRWGLAYVHQWAAWNRLPWLAPLAVLLRVRQLPWILAAAGNLLWAWSIGGDFMAWSRFLVPATASLAMLVVGVSLELEGMARRRHRAHRGLALVLLLAVASALLVPARVREDRAGAWIHGIQGTAYETTSAMDRFAATRFAAGRWLAEHVDPSTRVSVAAAGALPYGAGVYVIDVHGLVDVALASVARLDRRARPGHQRQATVSQVLAREPDLVCHLGEVVDVAPDEWLASRRLGLGWTWACVPTGEFSSARDAYPATLYCCLRRASHVVPPFGETARAEAAPGTAATMEAATQAPSEPQPRPQPQPRTSERGAP